MRGGCKWVSMWWNDLLLDVGGSIVFGISFSLIFLSVLVFLITVSCRVLFFSCINCRFSQVFPHSTIGLPRDISLDSLARSPDANHQPTSAPYRPLRRW